MSHKTQQYTHSSAATYNTNETWRRNKQENPYRKLEKCFVLSEPSEVPHCLSNSYSKQSFQKSDYSINLKYMSAHMYDTIREIV